MENSRTVSKALEQFTTTQRRLIKEIQTIRKSKSYMIKSGPSLRRVRKRRKFQSRRLLRRRSSQKERREDSRKLSLLTLRKRSKRLNRKNKRRVRRKSLKLRRR